MTKNNIKKDKATYKIIKGDCLNYLYSKSTSLPQVDLTFLDPPFNQGKKYNSYDDKKPEDEYWHMMERVCKGILKLTSTGGSIYFMQREKNTGRVLECLKKSGWTLQNLIIWKKKTSAVPAKNKFGKHYQVIAFASKGKRTRTFNKLRISPPLPSNYNHERESGIFVTDVWDDIRELTSGYFAGEEAFRKDTGERFHKQQSPIALLLRIILSSTEIGDTIFDPFAGTGTTMVVAYQLDRKSIGIEIDPENVACIEKRLNQIRDTDNILKFYKDYKYTPNLKVIWDSTVEVERHAQETMKIF